jgi:hypothetical protein
MSSEWINLIISDLAGSWQDTTTSELSIFGFLLLWVFILAFPLKGIDRRDFVSGLCYTLFCTAAGVMLIIVLPQGQRFGWHNLGGQAFEISGMALVSIIRWAWGIRDESADDDFESEGLKHGESTEDRSHG